MLKNFTVESDGAISMREEQYRYSIFCSAFIITNDAALHRSIRGCDAEGGRVKNGRGRDGAKS